MARPPVVVVALAGVVEGAGMKWVFWFSGVGVMAAGVDFSQWLDGHRMSFWPAIVCGWSVLIGRAVMDIGDRYD